MSGVNDVTDQEFETEILKSETPVLVDFWADWCVPCHMVSPVVEEIGTEKSSVMRVAKLNVDDNPDTARKYGVMSIPTLILFVNGRSAPGWSAPSPRTPSSARSPSTSPPDPDLGSRERGLDFARAGHPRGRSRRPRR